MAMSTSSQSKLWPLATKRTLFTKHNFVALTLRVGVTAEVGSLGPMSALGTIHSVAFPSVGLSHHLRKQGMSLEAPS